MIPDYQTLMLPVLRLAAECETRVADVAERIADDLRLIDLTHLVQPAADAIDLHLTGDRRHRQNMSILIGAGFVALNGRAPSDEEAQALATEYAPAAERHALEAHRDDAQECFDHLLSYIIEGHPLGDWLAALRDEQSGHRNNHSDAERIVTAYGMRVIVGGDAEGLYIANGAPGLREVFRDTPWAQRAWQSALRKLDGAFTPSNPIQFRVLGKKRALGIPLSYLPDESVPSRKGEPF